MAASGKRDKSRRALSEVILRNARPFQDRKSISPRHRLRQRRAPFSLLKTPPSVRPFAAGLARCCSSSEECDRSGVLGWIGVWQIGWSADLVLQHRPHTPSIQDASLADVQEAQVRCRWCLPRRAQRVLHPRARRRGLLWLRCPSHPRPYRGKCLCFFVAI